MVKLLKKPLMLIFTAIFAFNITACNKNSSDKNETISGIQTVSSEETGQNGNVEEKEPVKMKFLYIWPEHQEVMDKSINMFMEANPHITVDVNVVPWSEVDKTLQTQIAANDVPDVFFQWTHQMAKWVELNTVMDLTPYLEKDTEWFNSFLGRSMFDIGKINGKYYNIPFRGTEFVIGYNKAMFEKFGWKRPETLQEFDKLMSTIASKGIIPFALYGKPGGGTVSALNSIFSNFSNIQSGLIKDPKYKTGRLMTDDTDLYNPIYCAQKMKNWLKKGYLGSSTMGIGREEAQNLFINGKAAMFWMNNNEITQLQEGVGTEIGVFAFPGPEGVLEKYVFGGFDGFSVSASTEHPEESIALLKSLTSKNVQQLWIEEAGSAMVVKDLTYNNPVITDLVSYMQYVGMFDVFADYNQGDYPKKAEDLTVEFLIKDDISAETYVKKMREFTLKAMAEAGVTPEKPSVEVKKIHVDW